MATTVADERTAIETAVQLYIDGASKGDAAKLKRTFHEKGWMFGSVAGRRFDAPFTTMIQELTVNPLDSDGGYSGRIVAVEQTGDGAVVTVEESGCWGKPVVHRLLRAGEDRRRLEDRQQGVRAHRWGDASRLSC
jgi:hypothetical protein